jgi:hypothetical protein
MELGEKALAVQLTPSDRDQ